MTIMMNREADNMQAASLANRVTKAIATAPNTAESVRLAVELIHESSDRYDWSGVYLMDGSKELVLSHFIGSPSPHTRIPVGRGVCGAAAREKKTIVVPDVGADPRYLACSLETKSEIVVPIIKDGAVLGEIDIDSHTADAFGPKDREALGAVAGVLAERLARADK